MIVKNLVKSARRIFQKEGPLTLAKETAKWTITSFLSERLLDFWVSKSVFPAGWYEINPTSEKSFMIFSHGTGGSARRRIRGELEPEVMDELIRQISTDMHVWDVGSAWGYFTHSIASLGATVTAFEVEEDRCATILEGARKNGWSDRVKVVQGTVGDNVSLNEFQQPDVIKMDIEGWEYEAIHQVLENLTSDPTWIVEVHEQSMVDETVPAKSGKKVEDLFISEGYKITKLEPQNYTNYHILAEKVV